MNLLMKNQYSLKVDELRYNEIKEHYLPFAIEANGDYVDFVSELEGVTVTGYLSNKKHKSITFIGEKAYEEISKWEEVVEKTEPEEKEKKSWIDIEEQIGSDEVGVGDFFLPMIVVAAYVRPRDIKRLKELGITDSKKINDSKIREIGPIAIKEFEYSKLALPNKKYNEMIAKGENLNSLKAKMHHRALKNIHDKYLDIQRIYVDQFVSADKFYSYLGKEDEPILKDIAFKTKGESYFPSVALASVISRYAFLLEKDKLEKELGMSIPFGAGKKADEFARELKEKIPQEEFDDLVKQNFKNYENLFKLV